jgi:hypothetical protein
MKKADLIPVHWTVKAENNRKDWPQLEMISTAQLKMLPRMAAIELRYRRELKKRVKA